MRSVLLALATLLPSLAVAAEHHVSPTGTASGTGSASSPWSLAHACTHPAAVKPGDTVWLHDGTYSGAFACALKGTSGQPITVRGAPGEWARIDGRGATANTLDLNGEWAIYRDFEVTNTDPSRSGSRAGGLNVYGSHVKAVNLVVHDTGGNGFWSSAVDSEVYGCIVFHNGYDASDRGHGHGLYTQNATGTKTIAENVLFGGYSFGIHAYTEGGAIQGFDLVGNVLFNAGVASSVSGHKDDCLVGGLKPADRIALRENLVWAIGGDTRAVQLGYSVANQSVMLSDNYFIGALKFAQPWSSITLEGNTLCTVTGVATASYPDNTYLTKDPTAPRVFVRPNKYEPGRAHVVVYNWTRAATVAVDPSSVLAPGARYELRNAQDVLAAPVLSGTWTGGALQVPTTGLVPAQPIGSPGSYDLADQTGTLFNVFLLTSTAGAAGADAGVAMDSGAAAGRDAAALDSGRERDTGGLSSPDAEAPASDAGHGDPADAGPSTPGDGGALSTDAGEPDPIATSGCGCAGASGPPTLLVAVALAALQRRRRPYQP